MAESVTLARPYAEAVFALARDAKALDSWQNVLQRLAAIAQDERVRDLVNNPKIGADQLTQVFVDIAGKLTDAQKNFVRTLVENERVLVLPEIYDLFVEQKNRYEGV